VRKFAEAWRAQIRLAVDVADDEKKNVEA